MTISTDNEQMKIEKERIEMNNECLKAWKKWLNDKDELIPTIGFTVGFRMAYELKRNKL